MKILLMFLVAINLFANDFRLNNWGDLSEEVLKIENLPSISYKENFKSKSFNTFKDDYIYNYSIDEYSLLKNRLYKGTYTKELKENDKSFERMKQYLIWKYGENYKTYGLDDNFEWNTGNTKIILNLFLGRSYIVEYYADSEYMKKLISDSENGREFIKELGTEFKEFNKIKEKL
mgnify:CR=1 FL=1